MRALALDLGTKCGWAWGIATVDWTVGPRDWGHWDLSVKRGEGAGMRMVRFRTHLVDLIRMVEPDLVVYERVARHVGTDAAHVYGGLLGILSEECERQQVPYEGVTPGEWKKAVGCKGNAGTAVYLGRVRDLFGNHVSTDDEAAAIGVLCWAGQNHGGA